MADGQIELPDQATRAEGGQCFAKLNKLRFDSWRSFLRLVMTSARKCEQAGRALLLKAAQPFADGRHGGSEKSRGRFDAALLGALDQPQTMVVSVFHLTYQIEVTYGSGHDAAILSAAPERTAVEKALRLGIPQKTRDSHFPTAATTTNPIPPYVSSSRTSIPLGGYDVSRLFQPLILLDTGLSSGLQLVPIKHIGVCCAV